jgi:putative transposase
VKLQKKNKDIIQRVIRFELNPGREKAIVLGSLTYASSKLWNVANYEREKWIPETGASYPDWFEQKSRLKNNFWYKNLPSQTAQEVLKQLDEAWQSYRKLKKTGGIKNPNPPRCKHINWSIRFLNKGFTVDKDRIRLTIPKKQKEYLKEKHGIAIDFLYIKLPENNKDIKGSVKVIEIIPVSKTHRYKVNIIVELRKPEGIKDNGIYMSIDPGINNLLTCHVSTGRTFIVSGRQLLGINRYYDKKIGYYQSIAYAQQSAGGNKYPKDTKRIRNLYIKRRKQVDHLLHAASKKVADIAAMENVCRIVMGDVSHIRDNKDTGAKNNQKFHKWPFERVGNLLEYKAVDRGINLIKQEESYTSRCSPYAGEVSKMTADKGNRKYRGLYEIDNRVYNADSVGAYNIMKKYLCGIGKPNPAVVGLDTPKVYRWNAQLFTENLKLAVLTAM